MDYHFYMKLLRQLKIQENFVFTANMLFSLRIEVISVSTTLLGTISHSHSKISSLSWCFSHKQGQSGFRPHTVNRDDLHFLKK